jgi:hypothetical protein
VKAFAIEPFEHIINGLIGEGGQEDALTLCRKLFDDLRDYTCFACSRGTVNKQIVLHLDGTLNGQILFAIKVDTSWKALLDEAWPYLARDQIV